MCKQHAVLTVRKASWPWLVMCRCECNISIRSGSTFPCPSLECIRSMLVTLIIKQWNVWFLLINSLQLSTVLLHYQQSWLNMRSNKQKNTPKSSVWYVELKVCVCMCFYLSTCITLKACMPYGPWLPFSSPKEK